LPVPAVTETADKARRQELRDRIARTQEAMIKEETAGNVSAVGLLFLESKHLQADLDKSLAVQKVHSDRILVQDVLVLKMGTNFFISNPGRIVFIGFTQYPHLFRTEILLDDPRTPMTEFGLAHEVEQQQKRQQEEINRQQEEIDRNPEAEPREGGKVLRERKGKKHW